ncbi:Transcription initiation factor TFIID, subunit TAF7, partial [Pseudoloma neurophilia]
IEKFGYPNCKFSFFNDKNIEMEYNDQKYRTTLLKLPTFIESHKSLDGTQLYKINNINKMLVIWPQEYDQQEIDQHIKNFQNSGITPPLKNVKLRRWRKTTTKSNREQNIKEIVTEMLRKDSIATSVDIKQFNMDKNDDELSSIAAELEKDLLDTSEEVEAVPQEKIVENAVENEQIKKKMEELLAKIEDKRQFFNNSKNPIVRRRFEETIKNLEAEYDELKQKLANQ